MIRLLFPCRPSCSQQWGAALLLLPSPTCVRRLVIILIGCAWPSSTCYLLYAVLASLCSGVEVYASSFSSWFYALVSSVYSYWYEFWGMERGRGRERERKKEEERGLYFFFSTCIRLCLCLMLHMLFICPWCFFHRYSFLFLTVVLIFIGQKFLIMDWQCPTIIERTIKCSWLFKEIPSKLVVVLYMLWYQRTISPK